MRERKLPTGTKVKWNDCETKRERSATVVRHGRDTQGVYTEIQTDDDGKTHKVWRGDLYQAAA